MEVVRWAGSSEGGGVAWSSSSLYVCVSVLWRGSVGAGLFTFVRLRCAQVLSGWKGANLQEATEAIKPSRDSRESWFSLEGTGLGACRLMWKRGGQGAGQQVPICIVHCYLRHWAKSFHFPESQSPSKNQMGKVIPAYATFQWAVRWEGKCGQNKGLESFGGMPLTVPGVEVAEERACFPVS